MRRVLMATGGALILAACGEGGSGTGSVAVVSGASTATSAPTATPTPTSTPTPSPTLTSSPTPTPSSSYTRYTALTGDQSFQTACASVVLGSGLPTPQPAVPFGESLALGYTAASASWNVKGDGVALAFPGSSAVAAPAGQTIYEVAVSGSTQRLAISQPVASGTTLGYTRVLSLRADRPAGTTQYSCVFGVPSLPTDLPSAAVTYARVSVAGTAYMLDRNGGLQSYALTASTGTVSYDPSTRMVTVKMHLFGSLQGGSTTATTSTDLGIYTGSASVDATRVRFAGALDSADRVNSFSSFSGAFFGGVEAGSAFETLSTDASTGNRVTVVGTIAATS